MAPISSADSTLQEAMLAHRAGRLVAAEVGYRRVLRQRPDDPKALHFLGLLLFHQGDVQTGVSHVTRSLQLDPSNARAWNALGGMYIAAGQRDEAKHAYERSTEVDPSLAEGWYNLAICLRDAGESETSIVKLREALARDPKYFRAHEALAMLLYQLGRMEEVRAVYRDWIAQDPQNATARHLAAAASGANVPDRASDEYVRDLFDQSAEKFDVRLAQLRYRAPELVAHAVVRHATGALADVLDAGCGTGLCGPLLREHCRHLVGVDLSPKMIDLARARASYDDLHVAELTAFMRARPNAFDAVISADTLVYFGALEEPLRAAHETLREGGLLVFTVEALDESTRVAYQLEFHGRYAHSESYIRQALDTAAFTLDSLVREPLRQELERDVPGYLIVARRR